MSALRLAALAPLPLILGACDPAPDISASPELALFGDGYPNPGDPCKRAGESAVTGEYLDDAADLVACPPGTDTGAFIAATGGEAVASYAGWMLISVPTR